MRKRIGENLLTGNCDLLYGIELLELFSEEPVLSMDISYDARQNKTLNTGFKQCSIIHFSCVSSH